MNRQIVLSQWHCEATGADPELEYFAVVCQFGEKSYGIRIGSWEPVVVNTGDTFAVRFILVFFP